MTKPLHFDGHPVAPWIRPRLVFARKYGWRGKVISGYRTPAEQTAAGTRYAQELGKPIHLVYPNGLLASNHCKLQLPGGAVDVTDPVGLNAAMGLWRRSHTGAPLIWGGPVIGDDAHFSHNGH